MAGVKLDVRAIFCEAVELPSSEDVSRYLDDACGDNAALRAEVETLLNNHQAAGNFLGGSSSDENSTIGQPYLDRVGTVVGPYKLRELLAEGGMGSVFVAEQEQPIRRKVALKVIKAGMDSRQVLNRFETERQTLALMDHPHIAKVLDAGTTDGGRPYFVMELVRGVPIIEFCDQRRLDPRQRLELFVQVCRAIQHAHQKGIIHRDIKPSNILVTLHDDLAVPKVIDFGIAKATGERLTEKTVYTAFNQMIGTPLYMSPEQAEMNALDVDTRSDVYSLGVLLYELLTGSTPFDNETLRQAGFDEMRRLIREVEPPRPSQRVSTLDAQAASTVSQSRNVDKRRLGHALRGDLDLIVMKALEKDRSRRYESASALAADVQRHLDGEPIEAKQPRFFADARKWCRRHRGLLTAAAIVLVVLVVGSLVSTAMLWHERNRTQLAAAESQAVANFLINDLLAAPFDQFRQNRELTVNDVLTNAESKISQALVGQPLVEATVRHTIARSYQLLEKFEKAESQERRALEIRRELLGPTHHDTLEATVGLAHALSGIGKSDEAQQLCQEALDNASDTLGPHHADTIRLMNEMVWVIEDQTKSPSKEVANYHDKLIVDTYELATRFLGAEHREAITAAFNKALWLRKRGEHEAGVRLFRDTFDLSQRVFPEDDLTIEIEYYMADIDRGRGHLLESVALYEDVLAWQRKRAGSRSRAAIETRMYLAMAYLDLGRVTDGCKLCNEALDDCTRTYGAEDELTINCKSFLADAVNGQTNDDQACRLGKEVLAWRRQHLGPEHPATIQAMQSLAGYLAKIKRTDESVALKEEANEISRRVAAPRQTPELDALNAKVADLEKQGKDHEARLAFEKVVDENRRLYGDDDPKTLGASIHLWRLLNDDGEPEKANQLLINSISHLPPNDWFLRSSIAWHLITNPSAKVRDSRLATELVTKACELTDYKSTTVLDTLAAVYAEQGDYESAVKWCQKAIELGSPAQRDRFTQHLNMYRAGKPWRQEPKSTK